ENKDNASVWCPQYQQLGIDPLSFVTICPFIGIYSDTMHYHVVKVNTNNLYGAKVTDEVTFVQKERNHRPARDHSLYAHLVDWMLLACIRLPHLVEESRESRSTASVVSSVLLKEVSLK